MDPKEFAKEMDLKSSPFTVSGMQHQGSKTKQWEWEVDLVLLCSSLLERFQIVSSYSLDILNFRDRCSMR